MPFKGNQRILISNRIVFHLAKQNVKNARKDGKNYAECMRIQLEAAKYNDYIGKVKEKFSNTYYFVKFATFYENNFN